MTRYGSDTEGRHGRRDAPVEEINAGIDRLLPELRHDTPAVTEIHPERIRKREAEGD